MSSEFLFGSGTRGGRPGRGSDLRHQDDPHQRVPTGTVTERSEGPKVLAEARSAAKAQCCERVVDGAGALSVHRAGQVRVADGVRS
jgi:hypothetical protein